MGKGSKSSKKFQKKHLKRAIDQRHVEQKYKQKITSHKRKNKKEVTEESTKNSNQVFEDQSVEEFFNGGFELSAKSSKQGKRKNVESLGHRNDLEDLAKTDPEFYKYLKENDKDLLDFDVEDEDESEAEEDGEEEEEAESDDEDVMKSEKSSELERVEVTATHVRAWEKSLAEHSFKTLKKVLKAFTAAVHVDSEISYKYSVTSPEVFNALLVLTLSKVPESIKHHVPLSNDTAPASSKKLKSLSSSLKSHQGSLNTLLSDNQDSSTIPLILKSIHELLPYFLSFRRLMKETINTVVDVAGRANTDDNSRLAAFSFLNSSAEAYRKSLLEIILKSTYSGIVKVSRRTTAHTMPLINMLKNSTVTLYSIDPVISYQQGFQFIRQLAIHLRSSITNKTAESYKTVYNWQYLHSLDFWSRVLCYQCDLSKESLAGKASPLRELIHPLVQVTLGAMRLIPTPQYFPLRFYLIRSLIRLSRQTGVYIPLLPTLTETLASTTISKKAKASTLKPLDFDYSFRAGKSYLGTRVYQDGVSEQFVDLTGEFFVLYCKSIAFPELSIPAIITLKRFIKRSSNIKFNKQLQRLLEKIDENSNFILQHRNNVSFGPCDKEQVAAFLKDFDWEKTPLGEYIVVQRKIKEEKARLLRESLEEDEGKNLDQDIDMESEIEVESEEDEEAEVDEDDD